MTVKTISQRSRLGGVAMIGAAFLVLGPAGCGADVPLPGAIGTQAQGAGTFTEVTSFGSNPSHLKAYKYVPENVPANAPLVVVLHACTQTARDQHDHSGWAAIADRLKFYVLYP